MTRRERLATLSVILAVILVVVTASYVKAQTIGSCGNPANGTVVVWENALYDYSDGNDKWWAMCDQVAGFGYPDLRQIYLPAGVYCHGAPPLGENKWNDCISSIQVWLASSLWRLCVYRDLNYQNLSYWFQGYVVGQRLNISPNDDATSIRLRNDGQC